MSLFASLLDLLSSVLHSFRQHKVRAFLTLLGMIIGAGSVVLLSGLLAGGEDALSSTQQFIEEKDVIEIENAAAPEKQRNRTQRALDYLDQRALDRSVATGGSPTEGELMDWRHKAKVGETTKNVMVLGASPQALDLYHVKLEMGRFIDEHDLQKRARVAVIGYEVWKDLLSGTRDLNGKSVTIGSVRWQVIGVLAHKPPMVAGPGTWMWDRRVVVPATTFQGVIRHSRKLDSIYIRVLPQLGDLMQAVVRARSWAKTTILSRHYEVENFKVDSDKDSQQQAEVIFLVINILMLCTAALSLFVGGINIMNIMLVTVTERTREIGIRRALGATRGDILQQFLLEAGIIAGLGGMAGVLGGMALVFSISKILAYVLGSWTAHYKLWAILLGLGSSTFTGVFFGLYPAWRAARLDPVEALRYE
ncbi:MAG TPA: ABC transporter permease [Pseudomonadota bacterium]|jgi:putative ABC transport system permease protein|nr:ABC transporter permease [Pseudomonadota bacterium]HNF99082.1 ABC transporter permease [Pseudomonadota bacterium]HNK44401.1 ABC transporter permease [Pseudomonadota bacterium]HNN50199.1 ABC transporter permease [Pseudomonadota bacterium]